MSQPRSPTCLVPAPYLVLVLDLQVHLLFLCMSVMPLIVLVPFSGSGIAHDECQKLSCMHALVPEGPPNSRSLHLLGSRPLDLVALDYSKLIPFFSLDRNWIL